MHAMHGLAFATGQLLHARVKAKLAKLKLSSKSQVFDKTASHALAFSRSPFDKSHTQTFRR
jgi:hypothetical protein